MVFFHPMARGEVTGTVLRERGNFGDATIERNRTTGAEAAAAGWVDWGRNVARENDALARRFTIGVGDRNG